MHTVLHNTPAMAAEPSARTLASTYMHHADHMPDFCPDSDAQRGARSAANIAHI